MIDEDSLEKYSEVRGPFRKRLHNSIDWEEGCFYQYDRRCAFLNDRNLCDLYLALGEEGFCDTCRNYPRHTEEFEGLRERSLSLSCPVAAEMILSHQGIPQFIVEEDDEADELEDEFEDFDLLLFTQLEDARNAVFDDLKNGSGSIQEKMERALVLAEKMQRCLEEGCFFEIEDLVEAFSDRRAVRTSGSGNNEDVDIYQEKCSLFETIKQLERLREEWTQVLDELEQTLYLPGCAAYSQLRSDFEGYLEADPAQKALWENSGLQLFAFFVYTYFCGAVYDDWIYSKMALAVRSVEFIRELLMARWKKNKSLTFEDYVELSYRYAREIEHSDINLNELEETFMDA